MASSMAVEPVDSGMGSELGMEVSADDMDYYDYDEWVRITLQSRHVLCLVLCLVVPLVIIFLNESFYYAIQFMPRVVLWNKLLSINHVSSCF